MSDRDQIKCPWYPDQLCNQDCQYLLPRGACIHEPPATHYARLDFQNAEREKLKPYAVAARSKDEDAG